MAGRKVDLISIIEAAYAVDSPSWLSGIMEACRPSMDHGLGMCAFLYDASKPGGFVVGDVTEIGTAVPITAARMGRALLNGVDADFVDGTYRAKACGTASEERVFEGPPQEYLRSFGVADVHVVNALDPSGRGFNLCTYLPKITKLAPQERAAWTRVSAHLASAYRLWRRTRRKGAAAIGERDSVLTKRGALEHAGPDAEAARTALREAVVSYGRARGALRSDPPVAVDAWPALVDRRWTLLDKFENDGSSYIIARRNDAVAKGPAALTKRERQVVACAVLGQENKLIAYSLGVSHATVRVLIGRAAAKLGVRTRQELISAARKQDSDEREREREGEG